MEVAIGNAAPPFQREVREWQRVDPNTGALLTGRLEADRWIRDHMNTYGKVVDSQNVSTPNGTHHSQRKQLEVLQARTATGGAVQVVRSQTVHTSSSRWNSSAKQNGINGTNFTSSAHSSPLSFQHKKLHGETQKTVTPYAPEPTLPASSAMNSTSSPPSGGVGGHRKQLDPNERETAALNSHGSLNRGKSVSNEDLADDDPEPCEWKRVSKIRRSLQYPKATSPAKYSSRPLDLPENLVSVSRIRQELENGRRLDRAMRNNHVDLAALDSILKGAPDPDHKPEVKSTKKATFITAESLKEIRGKLRKLSDESLYKDDILVQNDEDEVKRNGLTMNESRTDAMQPSTYASHLATTTPSGGFVFKPKVMANGNSNSLQSRNKVKDLANNEWHYRRKSYGFEKMTPPPESMTSRMETSTDSGIGRSGDISSSWSPTENAPRGTVITLAGDDGKEALGKSTSVTILSNGGSQINSVVTPLRPNSIYFNGKPEEVKRHSIAVDESKYVKEPMRRTFEPAKTSSIHINGSPGSDSKTDDDLKRGQKRVEFCKTEVHFAAESGRVNIIETDGKPPPTNNFRRRRRSSGGSIGSTYLEAIKSGVPLTHFGDSEQPPEQPKPSADLENNIRSSPTITTPTVTTTTSTATNGVRSAKEEEEDSNDEISLRGILKNKPVKPRPYHLGENIENSESLWGVRLRPVSTDCTLWTRDASQKSPPLIPDDSDCNSGFHSDSNESVRSVAERVRIVEQLRNKDSPTGFSTKVNLTSSQSFNWPLRENYKPRVSPAKADIIHSNLLSIPLHSPTNSLRKPTPKTETPIMTRTTSPVKTTPIAIRKSLPTTDSKIISQEKEKPKSAQEPLKLVCGTRKLRDHELSYFGVNTTQQRASVTNDAKKLTNHAKTETPSRWKWTEKTDSQSRKEPIYENLKYHSNSTSNVVRHPNYDRDQDILDELNRAADEILSSVSKNHDAEESRTRRRIQSKPLETITEARSSTPKSVQSRGIQVSRGGSESVRRSGVARSSCRVSSASSSESIPRQIPSSSLRASTHSSSSKSRHSTRSHEDSSSTRSSKRRVTSMTECRRLHRTSSRDTVPSQASSSEDVNEPRRPRRLKVKEKPESSVTAESKRSTSSSKSSSRRHSKPEGTSSRPSRSTSDHHQKIRVKSGIVTTTSSRNGSNWLLRESRIE
ncbi:serine-rich adhesin for platelets isoform X2 [Phlebotomus argentipes]|uniref:serine-rich adhesin for platelets isoform X2 n=1 Tax=Phlebotomus argentipes TaxID=94469 RepID=UPI00289336EE|nr:serine-rich adhesin for platelets isoform X2 [Phlebotomus argentipes]